MEDIRLKSLVQKGLSLLRLTEYRWMELLEGRNHGTKFSLNFPHSVARSGKPGSLVLVAVTGTATPLHLGLFRSVQTISTLDSRVMFDLVQPITPHSLDALISSVHSTTLRAGARKLITGTDDFQRVSPKLGEHLIDLITAVGANSVVLQRILATVGRPKIYENAHALQHDALDLALRAFGAVDGAAKIALRSDATAIGAVRLQEDAVIEHDARWISGWDLTESDLTGKAVFTRRGEQLEVFTANKRPLEELMGVDLIYLNKSRGALVMVQYKMMERREHDSHPAHLKEQEWTVQINKQFLSEIERMERFDRDFSPEGPYRLNPGAFFFKLVRRRSTAKSAGILLSLHHFNKLMADGCLEGSRGGLRISYKQLNGHYLRSEAFIELVRSGYIGTRDATTDHLRALIQEALTGGRAVVAALQTALKAP